MQKPIPSIKSILETHHTLAKKDTFDITKGHLSALEPDKTSKILKDLSPAIESSSQYWRDSSNSAKEILPKIASSIHFSSHAIPEKYESPQLPKSPFLQKDPEYSTKGLTQTERFKKAKLKSASVNVRLLTLTDKHSVVDAVQTLKKLSKKNQTFGPVLEKIHDGYIEYLGHISRNSALKSRDSLRIDHDSESIIKEFSEKLHSMESVCLKVATDIKNLDAETDLEKDRVKKEKIHFDKFKFLHHDKPIYKAKPFNLNSANMTEMEKMNIEFHEIIELVEKVKDIEREMQNKALDPKHVLKNEHEKDSLALNELIHDNGNLQLVDESLEKQLESIDDSIKFFMKTEKDPHILEEFRALNIS